MKGQAIFHLLTILREETDQQNRFSQQALSDRMQERFGHKLNRRTLKAYLDELLEAGYPLNAEKRIRTQPDGTEEVMLTDWYLEPQFEVSELRMLCDLLAGMPAIPDTQRELLMQKLMTLAPPTLKSAATEKITYLHQPPAQQLLFSVEMLCEAIHRNCMISFSYGGYYLDADGKPVMLPRRREDGAVREYMVSPYGITVSHGRYYLICCKEPYRTLSNYRIDRMMDVKLLEQFERLPLTEVSGEAAQPKQLAEQLYMYSGDAEEIQFIAEESILTDVLDWFGSEIEIARAEQPHKLVITVHVQPTAMVHWALQYGKYVTVISPESLRTELAETALAISNRYASGV